MYTAYDGGISGCRRRTHHHSRSRQSKQTSTKYIVMVLHIQHASKETCSACPVQQAALPTLRYVLADYSTGGKYAITLLNSSKNIPRNSHTFPKGRSHTRSHQSPRRASRTQNKTRTAVGHELLQTPQRFRCPFIASSLAPRRIARSGPQTGWAPLLPDVRDERKRSKSPPAIPTDAIPVDAGRGKRNGCGTTYRNDLSDTA